MLILLNTEPHNSNSILEQWNEFSTYCYDPQTKKQQLKPFAVTSELTNVITKM